MKIELIQKCSCGALTVEIDGESYSMSSETFDKKFPNLYSGDYKEEYYTCNHCVNHWGIDICGCGSGNPFEECEDGFPECGTPSQSIEDGVASVKGGWIV